MTFAADQIGTTGRYKITRNKLGVLKWLKTRDSDSTKIWGDPHIVAGETVMDFEPDTAFMLSGILNIADD